ncbi:MAG TPA: nucleoside 2-deoxyribosyltransferase, partial [Eubacterium sp.]|nr:nucleoside 2-deoxyribosyltransferase [Eubacterium sp.]
DVRGIDACDVVVALYYGGYSDSGTAWEIGYAHASHKPVVVVQLGEDSNLMIHEGCHTNLTSIEELESYDFDAMPRERFSGKMF